MTTTQTQTQMAELANTIAAQAEALSDSLHRNTAREINARISLIENNVATLKAWGARVEGEQAAQSSLDIARDSPRLLSDIAADITKHWVDPKTGASRVYFGAVPYLDAMRYLGTIDDRYFNDSARSVINYFLSNASTFRGADAGRIKRELKAILERK